eukprot:m.76673 g.76673  ORF g.76673 m.76673 type:complete len:294 (+) comp8118_c0_seq3:100-981(+)
MATVVVIQPTLTTVGECSVCLESLCNLYCTGDCEHVFCRECIANHLQASLARGAVPAACLNSTCGVPIASSTVEAALEADPRLLRKYERMARLKSSRLLRECPRCDHIQAGRGESPAMTCEECNLQYCFFHAGAHPHTSCAEFEQAEASSMELIRSTSRPCPTCKTPVELASGCAHVVCANCHTDFCFNCGRADLTGTVIRTCPGCNSDFVVHRYFWVILLIWLLLLPMWLCWLAGALVMDIIGCPFLVYYRAKPLQVLLLTCLPFAAILDMALAIYHCECCCFPLSAASFEL